MGDLRVDGEGRLVLNAVGGCTIGVVGTVAISMVIHYLTGDGISGDAIQLYLTKDQGTEIARMLNEAAAKL